MIYEDLRDLRTSAPQSPRELLIFVFSTENSLPFPYRRASSEKECLLLSAIYRSSHSFSNFDLGIGRNQDLDWHSTSSWHSTTGNSPSSCAPSPQFTSDLRPNCLVCQGRNGPSGRHGQSGEIRKHYNGVCLSDYQARLNLVVQVYFRQFLGETLVAPVPYGHPILHGNS